MKCEKLAKCPFYNNVMPIDSGMGTLYRKNYCESDNSKCARYLVSTSLGPQFVPVDLYPNMHSKAEQIINDSRAVSSNR